MVFWCLLLAMFGTHPSRALNCHPLWFECLDPSALFDAKTSASASSIVFNVAALAAFAIASVSLVSLASSTIHGLDACLKIKSIAVLSNWSTMTRLPLMAIVIYIMAIRIMAFIDRRLLLNHNLASLTVNWIIRVSAALSCCSWIIIFNVIGTINPMKLTLPIKKRTKWSK